MVGWRSCGFGGGEEEKVVVRRSSGGVVRWCKKSAIRAHTRRRYTNVVTFFLLAEYLVYIVILAYS